MGTFGDRHRRIWTRRGWLRVALAVALGGLVVALVACGQSDNRNANRPPVPINISVQMGTKKVTVSPAKFGAGPITLLVANQSGASQILTIDGPRVRQSLGPINPEDTATLQIVVQPGAYTLAVDEASGLRPAHLTVGPKRPSAQNTLLLP
jgi:anti-sigma-K factor RskA